MSYLQKILQPNEQVLFTSRLHWLIYAPAVLLLLAGLLGAGISGVFVPNRDYEYVALAACGVVIFVGLLYFLAAWIKRVTTEIAVTDRRVIYKSGLIRLHTIEMHMDKIESVDVDQSIAGRIFDFGTILIHGTGSDIEPLRRIEDPIGFRNSVTAR